MQLEYPIALLLLLLLPILIGLYRYVLHWKKKTAARIGDEALIQPLIKSFSPKRFQVKFLLSLLALLCMISGLANLQYVAGEQSINRKGIDIIIALDVSTSMLTEDVQPNRLQRAKILISELIQKRTGDRMGLLLFAGHAYLQMPLSTDLSALSMYVQTASPEAVPTQGTVLAEAIRSAQYAFDKQEKKYKAVVLISDGENHESDAIRAAKETKDDGIVLYTVGVGTAPGQLLKDPESKQPKLNKEGQPIISKLNEPLLVEMAQQNGGNYFFLTDVSTVAEKLSTAMDGLEKKQIKDKSQFQYSTTFYWFLGLAFLLLLLEFLLSERTKKMLTIFVLFLSVSATAQQKTDRLLLEGNTQYTQKAYADAARSFLEVLKQSPSQYIAQYNLGNTYYRDQQPDKAIASYEALNHPSVSKAIRARALYNLGVVLGQQKKLDESIIAYKNSLRLNPLDEEARENLQRALREKQQNESQQPPPKPQPKEKMTQKQIKQLLNALQEQENQLRQRMNKMKPDAANKPEKDW